MPTRDQPQRFLGGFLGLFVLLVLALPDDSAALTLTWDPNSEEDLGGYKVHVGIWGYGLTTDIGKVTTSKVPDLQPNTSYFFAVTVYDVSGNESVFSNEVSAFAVAVSDVVGLEQGAAVSAVDLVGNESGQSEVVSFDKQGSGNPESLRSP